MHKILINKKGLTLIEIIVTLAVLGVVVTPLMNMFLASHKINNQSDEEYVTLQLAQKYMEDVKSSSRISDITSRGYEDVGGGNYKTPNPDADKPYEVDVIITPKNADFKNTNDPGGSVPAVTIYDGSINWKSSLEDRTETIVNKTVDITFESDGITVEGTKHFMAGSVVNIKVILETDEIIINFVDSKVRGRIFLADNAKVWDFFVYGGESPEIIPVKELTAIDVLLYDIKINIYKGSGLGRTLVNRLESTNIFK